MTVSISRASFGGRGARLWRFWRPAACCRVAVIRCFCLICCSETVSFDVWSCHVELESDCRLVGRWFGRTVSGRVHSQEINMDRDLQ